jgi:PAS domain S-box-containing protein
VPEAFGPAVDAALEQQVAATLRSVPLFLDGTTPRFCDVEVQPLPSRDGPARAVVVVHDVTERVTEHERARLFYSSFLTSTNAMEVTDRDGVLVDVNPAFERIYGYSREECIGRKPNLVRSGKTPAEVYERMWEDLTDPRRGSWSGEMMNRDRKGRERPVFLTISAIRDESGTTTHYLGVAVDLTEQRSWERRAAHADKLASIGQLAAGVAHEINTPLANIMLITEGLRRRSSDPATLGRVDAIAEQSRIAAEIVRGLLDFARRGEPRVADIDLVAVCRDTVAFLRGKQPTNVEVEDRYPAGAVTVSGDRGQLVQVITNILNNAYEVLDHGGRIILEVRAVRDRAEVEILDSGPGISEEALPHIFEPFFTTKEEGKGTGLGLAICHGIVQAHHGTIRARNVPGAGACFVISLPLVGAKGGKSPVAETRPPKGG